MIAKLCRHMEKSGRCSRTIVHELRRACRAAEAAAWLLAPAKEPAFKDLRTCLKRLRRRAGNVRDVDVARLVLWSFEKSKSARDAVTRLRESLKERRRRASRRLLLFIGEHPRGGIDRHARELIAASKGLTDTAVLASLRSLESRVRRLAADRPRSIDAIHTLRIAGKRAVLAGDILRPMPSDSNPLAALVDQIGRLLDIQVTIELARDELQSASDSHGMKSASLLRALNRQVRTERSQVILLCAPVARSPRSRPRSVQ